MTGTGNGDDGDDMAAAFPWAPPLALVLLPALKAYARVDFEDDDEALVLGLSSAIGDVFEAANCPPINDDDLLPADLRHAIIDHAAALYDAPASATERDRPRGLSLAASRITARYRGVGVGIEEGGDVGT